MKATYSTKEASEITGASRQIIRTYTTTYAQHFSTEGSPNQAGQPRSFTRDDLRLIRFIYEMTKQRGQNHSQVLERLRAGELDRFEWEPPNEDEDLLSTDLVPVERLLAARVLLEDAQRREHEATARAESQARELRLQAKERERELQEQVNQLLRELGHKEGELAAIRASKPKGFWTRLLGRN
jgi:DNA-binding transcriptional MerR regulator